MNAHSKASIPLFAMAVLAFCCLMGLPASAYADAPIVTVNSGWKEIICVVDKDSGGAALGDSYGWKIFSAVTVTDGVVTDVVVTGRGNNMVKVPDTEAPYFEPCHYLMEEAIIDASLSAFDPDAVDDIDVVSGATSTSYWIKEATKEALVKWNTNRNEIVGGVIEAIEAIATADDYSAAVDAAVAAYDNLAESDRGYLLASEIETLSKAVDDKAAAASAAELMGEAAESGSEADAAAARAAYDALTDDQKALVPADVLAEFVAVEEALADVANGTVVVASGAYTYTGKPLTPAVTVKSKSGATLEQDVDYSVTYEGNTNVGTAIVTVNGIGAYTGTATATFTIAPKAQTIKAAKTYKVKFAKVKKKKQTVSVKFTADGGGKITYAAAKNGKVSIAKNGKVTVKKGAKKGTYTLKVKVTAAANGNYAKTTKTVALKVKVA